MSVNINYQNKVSIANFIDKSETENEDFALIDANHNKSSLFYAVSDGAGGCGVYCKEWAKYLAIKVPKNPQLINQSKSIDWFYKISKGFYEEVIAKQDLSDLVLQRKVFKEGSYATLVVCWIDKNTDKLFYSSIGDSCLFYFEKQNEIYQLKAISSLNQQDDIDDSPNLLNWNIEIKQQLPFDSFEIENDFKLILASDSLSKWILLSIAILDFSMISEIHFNKNFINSLQNKKQENRKTNIQVGSNLKDLNGLFDFLKTASKDKDVFKQSMTNLYENSEIEIDDYSLIYVEGNVSK